MFSLSQKSKTRKTSWSTKKRRFVRRLPLYLEVLEDRILLSADNWIGGSGNWDDGSNWSLGSAPGTGDTAIINTSSAATISIQSSDTIQVQSITTGSNDTLSIIGGSLSTTSGNSTLNGALLMTGGTLTATGSGVSLTANGTTTVSQASLYAKAGATLSLPLLTSYVANGTFQADGSNSVLDLSALTKATSKGSWHIDATNGGQIKLTGMTNLSGDIYNYETIYLSDTGNSTLSDGNLTALNGVYATLDGTDKQVASSWTKFTNGQLTVKGRSYTLSNLTDVDDSSLYAQSGGILTLTGLTSYDDTAIPTTFQADGANSVLDVSALTTVAKPENGYGLTGLIFEATNGGELKLTGLTSLSGDQYSGFTLTDTGNSTLLDSNLTTLSGVSATLDGTDNQVANSWTKFTDGSLTVSGGTYNLAGLTDVDDCSLIVQDGGSLTLPGITNYAANGTFQADGANSELDLSALTKITSVDYWHIDATKGGEVNLSGLTGLVGGPGSNGAVQITDTGNSTLLDGNVTNLDIVNATLDGTDKQVANSWTKFTNGILTITGGSYILAGLTNVDG